MHQHSFAIEPRLSCPGKVSLPPLLLWGACVWRCCDLKIVIKYLHSHLHEDLASEQNFSPPGKTSQTQASQSSAEWQFGGMSMLSWLQGHACLLFSKSHFLKRETSAFPNRCHYGIPFCTQKVPFSDHWRDSKVHRRTGPSPRCAGNQAVRNN